MGFEVTIEGFERRGEPDGRTRTYRVASLQVGPVGCISYNMNFDCYMCSMLCVNKRI